ncbi:hypothetical protein BJV78DRAFT_1237653 [Lactifluus subvellereus]|nr:hypothetical protein BJV78DRAFT_1237653 [Lactifluus subvellereus]
MPLRRLLSTFGRAPSRPCVEEDVAMADATEPAVTADTSPTTLTPSRAANCSTSLGKRRHREAPEDTSQPLPSVISLAADPSTVATPGSRRPSVLTPINTTPIISAGPSSSHPLPPSPAPTEIIPDVEPTKITAEDRMATLLAEGIKVRDFIHEPVPNSCKAPEVFDPLPSLIAADWHMRNPKKNHGLLSGKALFRLIKLGWLSVSEVSMRVHGREFCALAQYSERPEEERYPFVMARNEPIPTPTQRVRMRRNAGFRTNPDDLPDSEFFGYDPTGHSDEEHPPTPPETAAEAGAGAGGEAEAEGPKVKRRKVKAKAKGLRRTKPLRRESSRPEV